jgi:hypothetical protein
MTEKNKEKQEAFEAIEKGLTNYIKILEQAERIFSKIEDDVEATEEFKAILFRVSYLKDLTDKRGIMKFDKSDLHEIAGTLNHLKGNLIWIKNINERRK